MINKEYRGFFDDLNDDINSYNGAYKSLLNNCPKFFKLLCDILKDKRTDWHTRLLVNSALAYFVLPEDIIPDYEEKGYIDDLFLTAFVLVEIKNNVDEKLLLNNWTYEENILELVESVHDRSKILIGDNYIDVLKLVGLRKYVSLDLNDYQGEYPAKIAKLADEKRELLGLLSFVVSKISGLKRFGSQRLSPSRELSRIKDFLKEHEDFAEIERIIHIAKERKNNFYKQDIIKDEETNTEDEFKKRRMDRIMREYKG